MQGPSTRNIDDAETDERYTNERIDESRYTEEMTDVYEERRAAEHYSREPSVDLESRDYSLIEQGGGTPVCGRSPDRQEIRDQSLRPAETTHLAVSPPGPRSKLEPIREKSVEPNRFPLMCA